MPEAGSGGGAPGGAAARWQGLASPEIIARARLGTGLANPSERGLAKAVQARCDRCSEEMPGTTRGLANPWRLPALHSLREKEKGDRRCPRLSNNRAAERWLN